MEYKINKRVTKSRINEILKIKENCGLTPENVVDAARDKNNPLHDIFEWNNSKAGKQWRLQQARMFINEIKVIIEDKEIYVYENVKVMVDDVTVNREYKTLTEIKKTPYMRKQILKQALDNIKMWKEKYQLYNKELKLIFDAIERTEKKFRRGKKNGKNGKN